MNAKFQNVTLWNHDNLPSQDDAFLRSFHWFAVAKAVSFYFFFVLLRTSKFLFDKAQNTCCIQDGYIYSVRSDKNACTVIHTNNKCSGCNPYIWVVGINLKRCANLQ